MDPLSITTPSLSIAIGVTRVTDAIVHFSRESKHAADDLSRISSELTALSSVLDPLSQKLLSGIYEFRLFHETWRTFRVYGVVGARSQSF